LRFSSSALRRHLLEKVRHLSQKQKSPIRLDSRWQRCSSGLESSTTAGTDSTVVYDRRHVSLHSVKAALAFLS
jgi:hypothetical protein